MKKRKTVQIFISFLLLISMVFQTAGQPILAENRDTVGSVADNENSSSSEDGVIVYSSKEFQDALAKKKSPITIGCNWVDAGGEAEASGRMRPIMIPEGTVIRGVPLENGKQSEICSIAPMQLEGDGVVFENIQLSFCSSDALWSIPHREIFLAGHSLTLNHVSTYVLGANNEYGPLAGSEKELLPTVCAGGYPGTSVGNNASLTVWNTERELEKGTLFKEIYMGHESEPYGNVPYQGEAHLYMNPEVQVRNGIFVNQNSLAEVCITGSGSSRGLELYGNSNTTLRIVQSKVTDMIAQNIGTVILEDSAWFTPKTSVFHNISLKKNACLDLSKVTDAFVLGNFQGGNADQEDGVEETGLLVLKNDGHLNISGAVTGQTRFCTDSKVIPGILIHKRPYIMADRENVQENPFLLVDKKVEDGFRLDYIDGAWTAWNDSYSDPVEIGSIEVTSSPSAVDVSTIVNRGDESIPNEDAFCKITWRDKNGEVIADEDVRSEELLFYEFDYIVGIKTEYWESEDPAVLEQTDWYNWIQFMPSEEHPGNYYIYSSDEKAVTGEYTFLFCSEPVPDLYAVADVKNLKDKKDIVKAECRILLFDSTEDETDIPSAHMHTYTGQITEEATCSKMGEKLFTCTFAGCDDAYTAVIAKTAHTVVRDEKEDPTCTKEGKTSGSHCSVCDKVIREQLSIPKIDHVEVEDLGQEATCTEEGRTKGSHCSVCNAVIKESKPISKTPHTPVIDPAEEATCTEEGKTQGSHCSVCNEVIEKQETTPKTPHTEVIDPGQEATCTTEGRTQEKHCIVCNQVTDPGEIIPKTAHDEQTQVTKASININGFGRTECTKCGRVLSEYAIVSPKTIVLSSESYVYDGTQKRPVVTVLDKNGNSIDRKYYTVDFGNNIDVGLAEVKVAFQGIYEGTLTGTFQILPKAVAIKKLKAGNKGFTVKWKKQKSQVTGYMIQYSANKKFSGKATKLVTVNKSKAASKKIKKLKAGKKYFVRICAYKTVQSGGQTKKLCSEWSKVKAVKVRK